MEAYGDRGEVIVAQVASHMGESCRALGIPGPDSIPDESTLGLQAIR